MKLTFLGSGNAGGVPLFGCDCPACERATLSAAYRRHSACLLIEADDSMILLDAGLPELATQPFMDRVTKVVLTHYHTDHVQGLFRIRWGTGKHVPVIGPDDPEGCGDLLKHPGILDFGNKATAFEPFTVGEVRLTPLPLTHSKPTFGYLIEHAGLTVAYLCDTVGLPDATAERLQHQTLAAVIIDCSFPPRDAAPRNHNDLTRALATIDSLKSPRNLLTHIGHELDGWLMEHDHRLPDEVTVACDGLVIDI